MAKKNQAAAELGKLGGLARAASLTEKQRKDSAIRAAQARWAKHEKTDKLVAEITEGAKKLLETSKANARRAKQKKQK
jgi:hypothetical protein